MQVCIYLIKSGIWKCLNLKKIKTEGLTYADLQAGGKSELLKAAGHGRVAKTQLLEQDGEKEKQGLRRPAKQLIIGSYY